MSSNPGLIIAENPATQLDDRRFQGGWDFVGDAPDPGYTDPDPDGVQWGGPPRSPEYGTSEDFRRMAQCGATRSFMDSFHPFYRKIGFQETPYVYYPWVKYLELDA